PLDSSISAAIELPIPPQVAASRGSRIFLQEFPNFLGELEARFLEQHEVRRVRDQDALLDQRMHQVAHQTLAILLEGPRGKAPAVAERGKDAQGSTPRGPTRVNS